MARKQPPRPIEIASESEDEMDEENTTNSNPQNIKEEITSDEEKHTSAPQESTILIESTDQSEVPEPAERPRPGNRNRPKIDFFRHSINGTKAQKPKQETTNKETKRTLNKLQIRPLLTKCYGAKIILCFENTSL